MRGHQQSSGRRLNRHYQSSGGGGCYSYSATSWRTTKSLIGTTTATYTIMINDAEVTPPKIIYINTKRATVRVYISTDINLIEKMGGGSLDIYYVNGYADGDPLVWDVLFTTAEKDGASWWVYPSTLETGDSFATMTAAAGREADGLYYLDFTFEALEEYEGKEKGFYLTLFDTHMQIRLTEEENAAERAKAEEDRLSINNIKVMYHD